MYAACSFAAGRLVASVLRYGTKRWILLQERCSGLESRYAIAFPQVSEDFAFRADLRKRGLAGWLPTG